MKKFWTIILLGIIICIIFMINEKNKSFEQVVSKNLEKAAIPGLGLGVIKNGELVLNQGFGYQNIEENVLVSNKTIFLIASISKLITGTAVMQLVEHGKINLDDSINKYLDFDVKNPKFIDNEITVRMLLTHTSSLEDSDVYEDLYTIKDGGGDTNISLNGFIENYFKVDGKYYSQNENFHSFRPGTQEEYANINFALLGYLVEQVTGQDFRKYVTKNIFMPLEMNNSSWLLADTDVSNLAVPYDNSSKDYNAFPHYGHPSYPDGFVRTTVEDLSRFFVAFMNDGEYKGVRILKEEAVEEMLQAQVINGKKFDGLAWDLCSYETFDGECDEGKLTPGHNGGDFGVSSLAFYYPETKNGIILLMNADILNDQEPQSNKYIRNIIEEVKSKYF